MKLSDKVLYALFVLGAVTLATFGLCAFDWLWAGATIAVVLAWAWLLRRRCADRPNRPSDHPNR